MAERLGNESGHFAMHVKGLELPAYDRERLRSPVWDTSQPIAGRSYERLYPGAVFHRYPFLNC